MSDPSSSAAAGGDSTVLVGPLFNFQLVAFFIAFTGIAIFNAIEVIVTTLLSFQRRLNWYFASLIGASIGVIIYQSFVFVMIYGTGISTYATITALDIGWLLMIGCQSMILWSRLHLVCFNHKLLRGLLVMIIVVTCSGFIVELTLALRAIHHGQIDAEDPAFSVCEKVVVIICCAQEFVLSCVYIQCTFKMLRSREILQKEFSRRKMKELVAANIFIILLDVTLLALEFAALWGIWCTFKGVVYSIKIKVEFAILTHLKKAVQGQQSTHGGSNKGYGGAFGSGAGKGANANEAYHMSKQSGQNNSGGHPTSGHRSPFGILDSAHGDHILRTTNLSVSYGRAHELAVHDNNSSQKNLFHTNEEENEHHSHSSLEVSK